MHHEIVTLRQVLKLAVRYGWLAALPDLSDPYRGSSKVAHRAWFSPEEYKQLYTATRANAKQATGTAHQAKAEQLHDFVLFMVNTGLRPDEANRLEYRDVDIVDDADTGETILEIKVRGKRGTGYCKSMAGAVLPFRRMVARFNPAPTDLLFKSYQVKQFNRLLSETGLKFDREGNRRTLYSLRHSYISFRLLEGADIYQIGLEASAYGTHSMRRTKVTQIYKKTGNLRAVQLLLGHTKMDSTVRYLGVELEDALAIAEAIEI